MRFDRGRREIERGIRTQRDGERQEANEKRVWALALHHPLSNVAHSLSAELAFIPCRSLAGCSPSASVLHLFVSCADPFCLLSAFRSLKAHFSLALVCLSLTRCSFHISVFSLCVCLLVEERSA